MGMGERERATMPQKEPDSTAILTELRELRQTQEQLAEFLDSIRGHQSVQTETLNKVVQEYREIMDLFGQGEKARTEAQKQLTTAHQQMAAAIQKLREQAQQNEKTIKDYISERERKLDETIAHTKGLSTDLTAGFGRLVRESKPSLRQRLLQTLVIAGSSVVGGIIVFLLLVVYQGDFHKTTASTSSTTTHHRTSTKTK